jgi:5-formyltetrahydrofolate cyclo-ligase
MPTKTELRAALKQTRLSMSDGERTLKSRAIVERLRTAIDWSRVKSLHFFEPIDELLEVDITSFISELEDNYPDLYLATPKLIEGEWRLVSARPGQPPAKFDVVIVPMLGFDPDSLQRIGYGGGYYDKFLAGQPQAEKIGVCFEAGKTANLPTESHDVPLDVVITEERIYR